MAEDEDIDFTADTTVVFQAPENRDDPQNHSEQDSNEQQDSEDEEDEVLSNSFLDRMAHEEDMVTIFGNRYDFSGNTFKKENLF